MGKQLILDVHEKLIVDLFAGGGGMSVAFERAFGRSPDIAINHNEEALSLHRANHPLTRHFIADVYEVCPHGATQGRPVGWLHGSPDCTDHSQASGGQPRRKKIRGLSWVLFRWAGQVSPDVISLENVRQILKWGPLIAKRDPITGRCLKRIIEVIGSKETIRWDVAAPGERVPVQQQYLIPDPKREGQTWRRFVAALEHLGYVVEYRILCAADLGGHTTRERLFMIARRDGLPISWPEVTHFKKPAGKQKKWNPAADCIDFSDLGKSIFTRPKPLAPATMRRIAKGIKRYVLDSPQPFIVNNMTNNVPRGVDDPMATCCNGGHKLLATPSIVPIAHYNGANTAHSAEDPLRTITAATKGGEFAVATPIIAKFRGDSIGHRVDDPLPTITSGAGSARPAGAAHALGMVSPILVQTGYGEREGQAPRALDIEAPLGTVVGSGKHAVATAYMMQANDGFNTTFGRDMGEPLTTITNSGSQQQLVTAHLTTLRKNCVGVGADEPLPTVTAGAEHHGLVTHFMEKYGHDSGSEKADFNGCSVGGFGRPGLENSNAQPVWNDHHYSAETRRTENQQVSDHQIQRGRSAVHGERAPVGLGGSERTDTGWPGGESQGCRQNQQSPDEPGTDDARRKCSARLGYGTEHQVAGDSGADTRSVHHSSEGTSREGVELQQDSEGTGDFADDSVQGRALKVAAFLLEYYSEGGQWSGLDKPLNTITTRDRLALVTVHIQGTPYVIVDIRLRMLKPRELFNGQDFPADYIIDHGHDGRKFSISSQVRMCGNSVNPVMAEGFLIANAPWMSVRKVA